MATGFCPKHETDYNPSYGCQECRRGDPPKGGSSTAPPKAERWPNREVRLPVNFALVTEDNGQYIVLRVFATCQEMVDYADRVYPEK